MMSHDLFSPLVDIRIGEALSVLRTLPANSIQCVVTSPPYFGLRDYDHSQQIGLEATPKDYVSRLVAIFREVWRILKNDGVLWLNLGDSYAGGGNGSRDPERWPKQSRNDHKIQHVKKLTGLANKQLIGIPWRVAFALQDDGWILRQDVIWSKSNPMPESVKDRCTKSHEYLFLFSKSQRYYFDNDAIKEPAAYAPSKQTAHPERPKGFFNKKHGDAAFRAIREYRNKRSVWTIPTYSYRGAHFATFPPDLIRDCILAGAPQGAVVLDPFAGSGTTGMMALRLHREAVLIELNPDYLPLIRERLKS